MLHYLLLIPALVCSGTLLGQPDTLYVQETGGVAAYAVVYPPVGNEEDHTLEGRYAMDTARIAVRLTYKRGKPCGTYRAWYPDGALMIFAVYGWGHLDGDWTEYAPDGRVTVKGRYKNGKRNGPWAFKAQGIFGHYKDGRKSGKWKYYENGNLVRYERYRDGELSRPADPARK